MMNPQLKAKWVKALRSGRYKQGTGAMHPKLKDGEKHCCLGVLEIVARDRGVGYGGMLTPTQRLKYGLSERDMDGLVFKNDEKGLSFDQIADYVEGRDTI